MLKFIECDWFVEKRITFHENLNIVVGDRVNSNSIGKSTLLKVIDFVYGGSTLLFHGKDVAETLGHHSYKYMLILDREYTFERNTGSASIVNFHDPEGGVKIWNLDEYLEFLKTHYTVSIPDLSFRAVVSPVTRVWGRENLDVSRPLHDFRAERGSQCIDYIIKVFELFGALSDLSFRLTNLESELKSFNSAVKKNIITKIQKSKYLENQEKITNNQLRLDGIRQQLAALAISVNELIDEKVLDQKVQKNSLLELKMTLSSELERVKSNLENNSNITRRNFQPLLDIIPSINIQKLESIESFHKGLTHILRKEIKEKESELIGQINLVDADIQECNKAITHALAQSGNPAYIVDSVMDISLELTKLSKENELYEKLIELSSQIKKLKVSLKGKKLEILEGIEDSLNKDISNLVEFIYKEARSSPQLTLKPDSYSYEIPKDTGTGKAYSNLILLDTSLLRHTKIPYLVHDSLLFKNVENKAIENLLRVYSSLSQQSFISLDGEIVESTSASEIVSKGAVIYLSSEKLLYTRDWRSNSDATIAGDE
ncbi:hypothetical protein C4K22_0832 [Pseudomonas chlororaphis subsp. aurantiaca]|uniref:DUF2326 domain-containing protein n=1 Tax=Pseudomonas chlororaphis TaxID=587753 RepID=UPI000F56EDEF|nr:DUF2326 domain-containing protein [Pseudomonas chlororaphis]AZD33597.1 hypothetical protein C4K22_0832 [Pseudomonas chlororaphis subsp. aurantiaca]AZD39927.1 hypothetical protein C4K21_0831 [Pseudomonas chlororaphis subsp. aurantiaca]